jgi:hypothetical protein
MNALPASRTPLLVLAAALAAGAPRLAAARDLGWTITGRPVDRIAGAEERGEARIFVLAGGEVLTLDAEGRAVARCAGFTAPPRAARLPPLGAPDADEVLRGAGLPDDDSTPEAEDALEDEGLGRRRRALSSADAGIVPRSLAAGATGVWIATSSGAFRGDDTGCRPAGLDGRDLLLVAASSGGVVMATEELLFRRVDHDDDSDSAANAAGAFGDSFTVSAGLAEPPRALALDAAGAALVADDDGVLQIGADGTVARILDRPTDALAVCGGQAVALADDGVYRWSPGATPVRTGDRPPIRGLGCGPTPEVRWIATGLGVFTSADAATWTERTETLGRRVAGAATVGERTWLAIDDRLFPLDLTSAGEAGRAGRLPEALAAGAGMPPISNRRLVTPTLPWPWVTALFAAERRTPDRRGWEVMLLLTFPLGRAGSRQGDPTALGAERIRRDEALVREETDLATDPAGDVETDARLEALHQEREALR